MDKFALALLDPSAVFHTPEKLLTDNEFTHDQKIQILKRWAYDIREVEVAQEENMAATQECRVELRRVLKVLHQLDPSSKEDHSGAKHG